MSAPFSVLVRVQLQLWQLNWKFLISINEIAVVWELWDRERRICQQFTSIFQWYPISSRHAARVKNPGGQVVLGGDNVSPLVEWGLTDPPKSGGAAAPGPPCLPPCCMPEFPYHSTTHFLYRVLDGKKTTRSQFSVPGLQEIHRNLKQKKKKQSSRVLF